MIYTSLKFLIFYFIVVFLYYYFIKPMHRSYYLLFTSSVYYILYSSKYFLLLLCVLFVTFAFAYYIDKYKYDDHIKKWFLCTYLILIIFFLVVFKYNKLLNILFSVGVFEEKVLPLGISFYVFTAISYIVDIYSDKEKKESNALIFATHLMLFTKIAAGPIVKASDLIPQLKEEILFNKELFRKGYFRVIYGFGLKLIIADRAAIIINSIYDNFKSYNGLYLFVAACLYSIQIYCDFAGYSYIAIGLSNILGLEIKTNFNRPYLAQNAKDFWKRWHISLSTWLRDYIYIPLGGSRKGGARKKINIMITMLVSGVWHGNTLNYIVWGIFHGLWQILCPVKNSNSLIHRFLRVATNFIAITFGWVFFRMVNIYDAFYILFSIVDIRKWQYNIKITSLGLDRENIMLLICTIVLLFVIEYICEKKGSVLNKVIRLPGICRYFFIVTLVSLILLFGIWGPAYDSASFIYVDF